MYWILIRSSPKKTPSWPPSIQKSYALSNRQSLQDSLSTIQITENWVPVSKRNRPRTKLYEAQGRYSQSYSIILNLKKQTQNMSKIRKVLYAHKWKRRFLKKTSLRQRGIATVSLHSRPKLFTYYGYFLFPPRLCPFIAWNMIFFLSFISDLSNCGKWLIESMREWIEYLHSKEKTPSPAH